MMSRGRLRGISVLACGAAALIAIGGVASRGTAQAGLRYLDQGNDWTDATRTEFYSRDQGSQIIKLAWLQALRQEDGQPFLADGLARYGYLQNGRHDLCRVPHAADQYWRCCISD
jgi:hypothetical protein